MTPQQIVARTDPERYLRDQFPICNPLDFRGRHGRSVVDSDGPESRQRMPLRPHLERALDRDWQDDRLGANGQGGETGAEGTDFSVRCSCPLRKNQDHFPSLQSAERLLDSSQPQPVPIDRDCVQALDEPTHWTKVEERFPGQIVHSARATHANQRWVEVALVVGNDKDPALKRDIFLPGMAHLITHHARQLACPFQGSVPESLGGRTLG